MNDPHDVHFYNVPTFIENMPVNPSSPGPLSLGISSMEFLTSSSVMAAPNSCRSCDTVLRSSRLKSLVLVSPLPMTSESAHEGFSPSPHARSPNHAHALSDECGSFVFSHLCAGENFWCLRLPPSGWPLWHIASSGPSQEPPGLQLVSLV